MTEDNFWVGRFGVRVPNTFERMIDVDEGNTLSSNGRCTELSCSTSLTKEQYLEKYTEKRDDGFYWYVGKKNTVESSKSIEP